MFSLSLNEGGHKDSRQRLGYLTTKVEIMALVHINPFYVILCVTIQNFFSAHENRKRLWSSTGR